MKQATFEKLQSLGYKGSIDTPAQDVINWLNLAEILRVEPYWRFLGSLPGYSWSKSYEDYSEKTEVDCETWQELLEIALEESVRDAL